MERASNGWTFTTLYAFFASKFETISLLRETDMRATAASLAATQRALEAALAAAERAVAKAEQASEKRFDGVNEFRAALSDQATSLMPRAECTALVKALSEKTDLAITAVNEKLSLVLTWQNKSEGLLGGKNEGWRTVAAVIVSMLGIAGIFSLIWTLAHSGAP